MQREGEVRREEKRRGEGAYHLSSVWIVSCVCTACDALRGAQGCACVLRAHELLLHALNRGEQ